MLTAKEFFESPKTKRNYLISSKSEYKMHPYYGTLRGAKLFCAKNYMGEVTLYVDCGMVYVDSGEKVYVSASRRVSGKWMDDYGNPIF